MYSHLYYNEGQMKVTRWDNAKSAALKKERGVSFEEMTRDGRIINMVGHPTKSHQRLVLYDYEGYVWVVPCVVSETEIFLKTMFPSRQYTKRWKKGEFDEKDQSDQG